MNREEFKKLYPDLDEKFVSPKDFHKPIKVLDPYDLITKVEKKMSENINEEIKYLLNSHHELIKAIRQTNKGLEEMNILIRGLIAVLRKEDIEDEI